MGGSGGSAISGRRRIPRAVGVLVALVALAAAGLAGLADPGRRAGASEAPAPVLVASPAADLSKIKHVIVIMQENRSFDHYFGMYPGADGIPVDGSGNPTTCVDDPTTGQCVYPWHDSSDVSNGGPHGARSANNDIDNGKMDGFLSEYETALLNCEHKPGNLDCGVPKPQPDAMSYKLRSDLPEYWSYADNYVLMDHMFGSGRTWSLPEHLFMVSDWSARCYRPDDPSSCENEVDAVDDVRFQPSANYAWTDVTQLLDAHNVPWGYYVFDGTEPDCENPNDLTCIPLPQSYRTGSIWNPLPYFTDVRDNGSLNKIQTVDNFAAAARNGTLPAVSWVVPTNSVSEHPPASLSDGRAYVTYMINQVMQGPDWDSSAIFLAWDDWGGFYDHVNPPGVDANGFGLRVPSLLISPYAKQGYVDSGVHSFDSYQRFIEDVFLGSSRLDPTTDGRPDPRPVVRENYPGLADLADDFDFTQAPRAPLILGNTTGNGLAAAIHPQAVKPTPTDTATTGAAAAGHSLVTSAPTGPSAPRPTDATSGAAPYDVVLDGSATRPSATPIASWTLSFGDGSQTRGNGAPRAVTHRYTRSGRFAAVLHVVDRDGLSSDTTATVTVDAAQPQVWIAGDAPLGFDHDKETFDASQSSAGNWTIDFGDGSAPVTGSGTPPSALTHTFATVGIYTTSLTVTDPSSGTSNTARAVTTVSASRAPTAITKTPDVGPTSAHLLADLWWNGQSTTYHFDWGTAPDALTNQTPDDHLRNGSGSPAVNVSGLTTGTTYYFRVVATNAIGTVTGDTLAFKPLSGPKVSAQKPSDVTATSVTLHGKVNPSGSPTQAWWEWGANGTLDHSTAPQDLGSGKGKVLLTLPLTGLLPKTKYSFRLVAQNSVGPSNSPTKRFKTLASSPAATPRLGPR